jgi:hypothetical protein
MDMNIDMTKRAIKKIWAFGLLVALGANGYAAVDALKEGFRNPPDSAKPHTWWHWVNGNVSQSGITKDLEAMKAVRRGSRLQIQQLTVR